MVNCVPSFVETGLFVIDFASSHLDARRRRDAKISCDRSSSSSSIIHLDPRLGQDLRSSSSFVSMRRNRSEMESQNFGPARVYIVLLLATKYSLWNYVSTNLIKKVQSCNNIGVVFAKLLMFMFMNIFIHHVYVMFMLYTSLFTI